MTKDRLQEIWDQLRQRANSASGGRRLNWMQNTAPCGDCARKRFKSGVSKDRKCPSQYFPAGKKFRYAVFDVAQLC